MRTIIKKAALLLAAGTMACASLFAQEMHSLSFRRTVKSPEITEQGIIQLPTKIPSHWKSLTVTGVGVDKKTYKVENPDYTGNQR